MIQPPQTLVLVGHLQKAIDGVQVDAVFQRKTDLGRERRNLVRHTDVEDLIADVDVGIIAQPLHHLVDRVILDPWQDLEYEAEQLRHERQRGEELR